MDSLTRSKFEIDGFPPGCTLGIVQQMETKLTNITLRGFKTIRNLTDFEPGDLTVLIGPNGAGKSNFISFFRMLSWAFVPPGQLQVHVQGLGGASSCRMTGPAVTTQIEAALSLATDAGINKYGVKLSHAAGDKLLFADEWFQYEPHRTHRRPTNLGGGHWESRLFEKQGTAQFILSLLRRIIVHQFHNTSQNARIRNKWNVNDNRWLKEDGGNLAAFLLRLQSEPACVLQTD